MSLELQIDTLVDNLKSEVETLDAENTLLAARTDELADEVDSLAEQLAFTESLLPLATDTLDLATSEIKSLKNERRFLLQTLLAIGMYEGDEAATPVNLARTAVIDFTEDESIFD